MSASTHHSLNSFRFHNRTGFVSLEREKKNRQLKQYIVTKLIKAQSNIEHIFMMCGGITIVGLKEMHIPSPHPICNTLFTIVGQFLGLPEKQTLLVHLAFSFDSVIDISHIELRNTASVSSDT